VLSGQTHADLQALVLPLLLVLQGDPFAPPPPAPRQGPRQQLASLLALADLCPEEWPQRGASQLAARQRDLQAAEGQPDLEGVFVALGSVM
jgi:hypothetical protein